MQTRWRRDAHGSPLQASPRRRRLRFDGARALVTGGSRGLGLALARELMQEGAHVCLLARDEIGLAKAKTALERQFGRQVETSACDLAYPAAFEESIARLTGRWRRIDLLANNAGIIHRGAFERVPMAEWDRAMAVHFWSPLAGMRAVVPSMRDQGGGRIINISSVEGRVAFPSIGPSCASKFALSALSNLVRAEIARERIWVTTVYPGLLRAEPDDQQAGTSLAARVSTLFAMPLDRAASRIVRASHDRVRSLELGVTTKLLVRADALFPRSVAALMEHAERARRAFE